jgi:hypothetical protein
VEQAALLLSSHNKNKIKRDKKVMTEKCACKAKETEDQTAAFNKDACINIGALQITTIISCFIF